MLLTLKNWERRATRAANRAIPERGQRGYDNTFAATARIFGYTARSRLTRDRVAIATHGRIPPISDLSRASRAGSAIAVAEEKERAFAACHLIIMWTLLYKGLMLKCTQDKLLKMFIIAVVIINYTHE